MSCIKVHSHVQILELVDRVGDTLFVGVLSRLASTVWITGVGRDIRKRVRFDHKYDLYLLVVLLEDQVHRVDVFRLVLLNAGGAVTCSIIVTSSICVVSTANFAI